MNNDWRVRVPLLIVGAFMVSFLSISLTWGVEALHKERETDLEKANSTFGNFCHPKSMESCLPNVEFSRFEHAKTKWQYTRKEGDWNTLAAAMYSVSKSKNLRSRVTVSTEPTNGAVIRYQTWVERNSNISASMFPDRTVSVEQLFLGEYFILAERNGKPTSDVDASYRVVNQFHSWTIKESGNSP